MEILGEAEGSILGMDRNDIFDREVNEFIQNVYEMKKLSGHIPTNGSDNSVKGVYMEHSNGQEGIIITFDEVITDER